MKENIILKKSSSSFITTLINFKVLIKTIVSTTSKTRSPYSETVLIVIVNLMLTSNNSKDTK